MKDYQRSQPVFFMQTTQYFEPCTFANVVQNDEIAPIQRLSTPAVNDQQENKDEKNAHTNSNSTPTNELTVSTLNNDQANIVAKKSLVSKKQRYLEFIPNQMNFSNILNNRLQLMSQMTQQTQQQQRQMTQAQMTPDQNQRNCEGLKRRAFMVVGLSKKQKLGSHLHSNFKK